MLLGLLSRTAINFDKVFGKRENGIQFFLLR